jgi:hypothetical protein
VIGYERFRYALMRCDGAQWRIFERLAHVFLQSEYPSLRPLASMSGDEGQDGSLFRPEDDETTSIQYSVRKDVGTKVLETCNRLQETHPEVSVLVYVTNQLVGADASAIRKSARQKFKIHVDVRDQEWLLAQRNGSAAMTAEAEEFTRVVADPARTAGDDLIVRQGQALSDLEAKAAFVYLGLQWEDESREKELTKLSFEALVRAVLRDTTSDDRLPRQRVRDQVRKLLPAHPREILDQKVDQALSRLSKVHIRHWQKQDEFCLTWDERVRLSDRLIEMESLNTKLDAELHRLLEQTIGESEVHIDTAYLDAMVTRARSVLERVFLDRGEVFASAVTKATGVLVPAEDIEAVVYRDLAISGRGSRTAEPRYIITALQALLLEPTEDVHTYLRSLSDTYTLFAFMRETPDVQSAFLKIFSDADIWLDTNVILPLLAEDLLDEHRRAHTRLLKAAVESGQRLHVSGGVLEEILTHINRSRTYFKAAAAEGAHGEPPFLLSVYQAAERPPGQFEAWLETFVGEARPEDDIVDYLESVHDVDLDDLEADADSADALLRAAVSEVWHEARERRDQKREAVGLPVMDPLTRGRLVRHDVENYVGVLVRRQVQGERQSAFGYKSWWLTLDGTAFRVHQELAQRLKEKPPASPAISPDFMLNYLAIGPVRLRLSKRTEDTLPLMMNMSVLDAVPKVLIELADELRASLGPLPPHVVARKIRDTLDEARLILGPNARAGEAGLNDDIKKRLIEQAKAR